MADVTRWSGGSLNPRDALYEGEELRRLTGLHWAIRLRIRLLRPYACGWNAWVRDITAWLER